MQTEKGELINESAIVSERELAISDEERQTIRGEQRE